MYILAGAHVNARKYTMAPVVTVVTVGPVGPVGPVEPPWDTLGAWIDPETTKREALLFECFPWRCVGICQIIVTITLAPFPPVTFR